MAINKAMLALGALLSVAAQDPAPNPYEALRALDARLVTVGTRLSVANLSLCEDRRFQPGMAVHDLSQFPASTRAEAASAYRFRDGPAVLALAPGAGADRAGLLPDDNIISADGVALPQPSPGRNASNAPLERILAALEAAFADGVATLAITRDSAPLTIRVTAEPGCASRFQVAPSARLEARADGRYVQLTSAMIEYTNDDNELAATVAHELAHNILRHRARLNAAGVERGLLAPFGRNGRLFRQTELEADRLAVHLMARAGFDPNAAIRLWTRQSRADSRLFAGTHPDWPSRLAALREEIAAIEGARRQGETAPAPLPRGPLRAER